MFKYCIKKIEIFTQCLIKLFKSSESWGDLEHSNKTVRSNKFQAITCIYQQKHLVRCDLDRNLKKKLFKI